MPQPGRPCSKKAVQAQAVLRPIPDWAGAMAVIAALLCLLILLGALHDTARLLAPDESRPRREHCGGTARRW